MKMIHSPCIHLCTMDPTTGYCIGCKRTLKEIEEWPTYSEKKQLIIIESLRLRGSVGRASD